MITHHWPSVALLFDTRRFRASPLQTWPERQHKIHYRGLLEISSDFAARSVCLSGQTGTPPRTEDQNDLAILVLPPPSLFCPRRSRALNSDILCRLLWSWPTVKFFAGSRRLRLTFKFPTRRSRVGGSVEVVKENVALTEVEFVAKRSKTLRVTSSAGLACLSYFSPPTDFKLREKWKHLQCGWRRSLVFKVH